MAEYGSGIFYGRSNGQRNSPTFPQLGILSLPSELDIGPPINTTAIKSNAEAGKDIIIIAEFSEVEGPIPLLTIPQINSSNLDLNDFVVQLMSTDYQNMGSSDFKIHKDTCLLQEDTDRGRYTYAHYFTLYDVRARGFVRPMCLAYISWERQKLKRYYKDIQREFCKATEYLRVWNLALFSKEMLLRIEDLHYTKERYIKSQKNDEEKFRRTKSDSFKEKRSATKKRRKRALSFSNDRPSPRTPRTTSSSSLRRGSSADRGLEMRGLPPPPARARGAIPLRLPSSPSTSWSGGERVLCSPPGAPGPKFPLPLLQPEQPLSDGTPPGPSPLEEDPEERSALQHTSLEALAAQLLDCQYILQVINGYLEASESREELDRFLDEVRSCPQSPLHAAMEDLGLLREAGPDKQALPEPTLFVISLVRSSFRTLRPIRSLCNIGYAACIAKLLDTFQRFSRSSLTLMFEELDREMYQNPFASLFIGVVPVIRVGQQRSSTAVPPTRSFSLSDARWNEDLVRLLRVDPSQASTPDSESEYADARENLDREGEVAVADDCLEVFTAPTRAGASDAPCREVEAEAVRSLALNIKGAPSHPPTPTPIRSASSDSSWTSSTPREVNLLDGIESELEEEEGEEEEVVTTDRSAVTLFQYDVAQRMEMGKLYRMSAVIQQFGGVSQCIVHSILSGKTMIVAGPEYLRSVVMLYTKTLSTILPVKPNDFLPVLKWHTGTITPYHLKMYKIIGTCIPERLHVQDLMSNDTLNRVTVLNIETGHISGVAYSGTLLYKTDQLSRRHFKSDASLQAALQAILISLGMKVFLHFHLLRTTSRTSIEILKGIGVPRGDWEMIQYLTEIVRDQMTEEESFS